MITLDELASQVDPTRATLFLGAGASIASGAPTAQSLGKGLLARLDPDRPVSGPLGEIASVLELRHGRGALIFQLREMLKNLQPAGGMLALPKFDWPRIYTTNYDYLVERAYEAVDRDLAILRSNYDYSQAERRPDSTTLIKVHGCLSKDLVDGDRARIVLTEDDYEYYNDYREVLFKQLDLDLVSNDLVVVGSSLRDPNIRSYMDRAARLQAKNGAPGRLYAVIYERDEERAVLLERKGYRIAFGSLDQFIDRLLHVRPVAAPTVTPGSFELPGPLLTKSIDVAHALAAAADVSRLYNGSPASYADVANGLTFGRVSEHSLVQAFTHRNQLVVTLLGSGGVGKTTLARRVLAEMHGFGYHCWEHDNTSPFLRDEWLSVEAQLRANEQYGVLLVDDCTSTLSQVNGLLSSLARLESSALLVLVTATSSTWRPRIKSPIFFSRGESTTLSKLEAGDLDELLNLVERRAEIRKLVTPTFLQMKRSDQKTLLRRKCGADMYVCLKNVFATESLDSILLREFAELDEGARDVYRLVAAVEATGGQVHRQLVLKLLQVDAGSVATLLSVLQGVVDEYDVRAADGIFRLATRHRVIAETIAKYKYADEDERYALFDHIIEVLNPLVFLELRLARDICQREHGIGSLSSEARQLELSQKLVVAVPAERIPRHRVTSTLIFMGDLEGADRELTDAIQTVGIDPPFARYKSLILLRRATSLVGIMHEDRYALLLRAESEAIRATSRFPQDPRAYATRAEVALAIAELTEDASKLDDAIEALDTNYDLIRDPIMRSDLVKYRDARRSFVS